MKTYISHLGIRPTLNFIRDRFIWYSRNKDCREWARYCLKYQLPKVHKYICSEQVNFDPLRVFNTFIVTSLVQGENLMVNLFV